MKTAVSVAMTAATEAALVEHLDRCDGQEDLCLATYRAVHGPHPHHRACLWDDCSRSGRQTRSRQRHYHSRVRPEGHRHRPGRRSGPSADAQPSRGDTMARDEPSRPRHGIQLRQPRSRVHRLAPRRDDSRHGRSLVVCSPLEPRGRQGLSIAPTPPTFEWSRID